MKILDASSVICVLKEIEEPDIFHICEKLNHELYITKEVYEDASRRPRCRVYQRKILHLH